MYGNRNFGIMGFRDKEFRNLGIKGFRNLEI